MRILVIEDDRQLAALLKKGLEARQYAVDAAHDGDTGFYLAGNGSYDLIVTDILLPGMNGTTLTRRLREEHVMTPVLMLTARDAVEEKVEGFTVGADDYLTKPFAFEELVARVGALVRRGAAPLPSRVLRVGDLELDTAAHEVRRDGTPISLGTREYAVLELLMRNAGRVLTRDELLTRVWGYTTDAYSNVVDTSIRRLRAAIDRDVNHSLIQTVRGVGYKISA